MSEAVRCEQPPLRVLPDGSIHFVAEQVLCPRASDLIKDVAPQECSSVLRIVRLLSQNEECIPQEIQAGALEWLKRVLETHGRRRGLPPLEEAIGDWAHHVSSIRGTKFALPRHGVVVCQGGVTRSW